MWKLRPEHNENGKCPVQVIHLDTVLCGVALVTFSTFCILALLLLMVIQVVHGSVNFFYFLALLLEKVKK